jgi:hypothetical protein
MPSCGSDARRLLADHARIHLVYGVGVRVNGDTWSLVRAKAPHLVAERTSSRSIKWEIWFERTGIGLATGFLFRWELTDRGRETCVDARTLKGIFRVSAP